MSLNYCFTRRQTLFIRCRYAAAAGIAALLSATASAQTWLSLPVVAPGPSNNVSTVEKVELGKALFFDPRFSSTGTVSCFSCHNVMEGGDDHRPTSIGVHGQKGGRNAPTVWNAAFLSAQFWDGRAPTLEVQSQGPPVNPVEMGMPSLGETIKRIADIPGYRPLFVKAFGEGDVVTMDNAAKAIAAYERTLITPNSAYDRFVKGDKAALTELQQIGMRTFASVGCTTCHQGPNFSGPTIPGGVPFLMKFPTYPGSPYMATYNLAADLGRFESTHRDADRNMWRVPTLRNLVYTAPYMHNGAVKTLPDAVRVMGSVQLNLTLSDADVSSIVAFLDSLTGPFPVQTMPRLPPTPGNLLE